MDQTGALPKLTRILKATLQRQQEALHNVTLEARRIVQLSGL